MIAYILLAICAGAMLPAQSAMNARLAQVAGSPFWAASFSGLLLTVATVAVALAVAGRPRFAGATDLPWWAWSGGLCGAVLLAATVILAARLGAAATFALVIAGQLVCSLVLDQFGLLGLKSHGLDIRRMIAGLLVICGAALMAK